MAKKGEDITTRFKVDISDLKAGISEANKQIKLANAEFKAASAGMDDWQKSSDGLNAKLKQLDSVLGNEIKKLQSYKDQLEKIEKASEENGKRANELKTKLQQLASQGVSKTSDEYKKYEKALNDVEKEQLANQSAADKLKITVLNQQAVVNKTEKEIRQYTTALNDLESESNQAGNSTEDLNKDLKNTKGAANEADGGFTVLKGTLANLTANVITSAISKIGELASSLFDMVEATEEYRSMMAKLEGATNNYGYQIDYTKDKFEEFYRYLGDTQMANNAISNLMGLQVETGTLDKLVNGAISTWSMYGDSIPIESLTESINETIQVGKVTGTFADALNWTKINQEELSASLGNGSAAQKAFNQAIVEGEAVEDAFSAALAATSDQGERANIVAGFLNTTYGNSKTTYDELNGAMLNANQSELDLINSQSKLAEVVSPVKDAFTQLKTQALEAILPIVSDLAQKFLDLKAYLEEHPAVAMAVSTAVTALAGAFGVLATALAIQGLIKGVTLAIGLLNTTLLANPIVLIVAAIAALVAGFITLWNQCDAFRNFWIGLWDGIVKVISPVIDWIKENWQSMILFLMNPLAGLFKYFYDNFEEFRNFVDGFIQGIKNTFNSVIDFFKNNWQGILAFLVNPFAGAFKLLYDNFEGFRNFVDGVVESIKNFFQPLIDFFTTLFNVIKELAIGCWNAIVAIWSVVSTWFNDNVIKPIKEFFTGLWNAVTNAASAAWTGIVDVWNTVSNWFNDNVVTPVKDFFTGMWDGLKNGAKNAWEGIKNVFTPVVNWFKDKFTKAWTAVKNVFSTGGKIFDGIKDGITSAFKNVVNAIIRGINKVIAVPFNAINNMLDKIRNVSIAGAKPFKGLVSRFNVPKIPELERGIGIAKKGHQYLLEGNGNEAVVPLDKNKYWIKAVADDMRKELQAGVPSNLGNKIANSNVNNFTQIINAPKTPSRIELYRDARNLLNYTKGRA